MLINVALFRFACKSCETECKASPGDANAENFQDPLNWILHIWQPMAIWLSLRDYRVTLEFEFYFRCSIPTVSFATIFF